MNRPFLSMPLKCIFSCRFRTSFCVAWWLGSYGAPSNDARAALAGSFASPVPSLNSRGAGVILFLSRNVWVAGGMLVAWVDLEREWRCVCVCTHMCTGVSHVRNFWGKGEVREDLAAVLKKVLGIVWFPWRLSRTCLSGEGAQSTQQAESQLEVAPLREAILVVQIVAVILAFQVCALHPAQSHLFRRIRPLLFFSIFYFCISQRKGTY